MPPMMGATPARRPRPLGTARIEGQLQLALANSTYLSAEIPAPEWTHQVCQARQSSTGYLREENGIRNPTH